jgi:hypothetical protein
MIKPKGGRFMTIETPAVMALKNKVMDKSK